MSVSMCGGFYCVEWFEVKERCLICLFYWNCWIYKDIFVTSGPSIKIKLYPFLQLLFLFNKNFKYYIIFSKVFSFIPHYWNSYYIHVHVLLTLTLLMKNKSTIQYKLWQHTLKKVSLYLSKCIIFYWHFWNKIISCVQ